MKRTYDKIVQTLECLPSFQVNCLFCSVKNSFLTLYLYIFDFLIRYAMKCLDKKRIKLKQGETLALNERIMLSMVRKCLISFILIVTVFVEPSENNN